MREYVTVQEIAAALGRDRTVVARMLAKLGCPYIKRPGRGGRKLFPVAGLPQDVREALIKAEVQADPAADIQAALPPAPLELKGWQAEVRDARLVVLQAVERMIRVDGKPMRAMRRFVEMALVGELNEQLAKAVALANHRKASRAALSLGTLRRWRDMHRASGPDALAPLPSKAPAPYPEWLHPLLNVYRIPSKPSLAWCYESLSNEGVALPSLRTVEREIR